MRERKYKKERKKSDRKENNFQQGRKLRRDKVIKAVVRTTESIVSEKERKRKRKNRREKVSVTKY